MRQDRFFDRAAARAAPPSPPPPKKPTSHGFALALARCVSLACSVACGVAVFLGIFPQNGANAGALSYVLPFVAAPILAFGMAAAWHIVLGVAAHATELHKQAVAFVYGAGLFLLGCFTSAWFLAAQIGGSAAIEAVQHQAIEQLRRAAEIIGGNASADSPLLAAVEHGGDAFRVAAGSEGRSGVPSRGKPGKGVAFASLNDAADNTARVASDMRQQANARADLLATANSAMTDANRNAAAGDAAAFEENFARATEALNAAEKIRLTAAASSLGGGWAISSSAATFVNDWLVKIEKVRVAALGARTELLALHLRDHQLQVRDQSLRAHQLGARLDQRRLQRIGVVGKVISGPSHSGDTNTIMLIRAINREP